MVSVNRSKKKGTIKVPYPEILLNDQGVVDDAHAGNWHRQVSLLAVESIGRFEKKLGRKIVCGEFAENITTRNIELHSLQVGTKLLIGEAIIEITQIGKKCHGAGCDIFTQVGDCVMPKEGIFCKVVKAGTIQPNNIIRILNH